MNIIKNIFLKYKSRWGIVFFIFFLCLVTSSTALASPRKRAKKARVSTAVTAQAAYAVDYTNGQVLYSRNPRAKFHPASTTKLLTALVVLDHKDLKDRVIVRSHAVSVEPTKAGLRTGVSYSVEDLLKVMLGSSANDAAVALAQSVSGSESAFAVLMNKKAKALGARNSNFVNPSGLPDRRQVTTAYDLTQIVRAALSQPFIASVMKKKNIVICGSDGASIQKFNHNKLLWRLKHPCVLGKTGYTRSAGHCYAGIAYYENRRVSIVILKSKRPWADIQTILGIPQKRRG